MKEVTAPASKSDAHRALFCAALSEQPWTVVVNGSCEDIEATRRCAAAVKEWRAAHRGAAGGYDGGGAAETLLDVGESGATLRFALPVAAALGQSAAFRLHGRLPGRPLSPLRELLTSHGAVVTGPCPTAPRNGAAPGDDACAAVHVSGLLTPGEYQLPGNVSSQFISGLLLALPLLAGDSRIVVTGTLESAPYVDMTLQTMRRFGVTVRVDAADSMDADAADPDICRIYTISGCQRYGRSAVVLSKSNSETTNLFTYTVEGDWSAAANWIVAGVIGPEPILIKGLSADSAQGDRAVVDILQKMGAAVELRAPAGVASDKAEVIARPSRDKLRGIRVDASQTPDLVPILALAATQAEGVTEIYNAERLRLKESDRLQSAASVLQALGFDVVETEAGLTIHGTPRGNGGMEPQRAETVLLDTKDDHRIVMMAAVASLLFKQDIVIGGKECVRKSYPAFFDEFRRLFD